MAEMLFRDLVKSRGDYVVGSAGVGALPGQTASKHTADILRSAGIDSSEFRSRPLTREMMEEATHVFAMSEQHLRVMNYDFKDLMDKVYLVTEFAADDAIRGEDVVDPIGMGRRAYEETRDMLLASLPSVLAYIDQTTQSKTGTEDPS